MLLTAAHLKAEKHLFCPRLFITVSMHMQLPSSMPADVFNLNTHMLSVSLGTAFALIKAIKPFLSAFILFNKTSTNPLVESLLFGPMSEEM